MFFKKPLFVLFVLIAVCSFFVTAEVNAAAPVATDDAYSVGEDDTLIVPATDFFGLDVNQDVTIYVALDNRNPVPLWLSSNFTDTGDDFLTTDTNFSIFARDYPPGTVTLGGNEGPGNSMYSVVVVPLR